MVEVWIIFEEVVSSRGMVGSGVMGVGFEALQPARMSDGAVARIRSSFFIIRGFYKLGLQSKYWSWAYRV